MTLVMVLQGTFSGTTWWRDLIRGAPPEDSLEVPDFYGRCGINRSPVVCSSQWDETWWYGMIYSLFHLRLVNELVRGRG